tara:strand:- start:565 stop:1659 length:1095 start_codon:yes stop_codon:yes gene_type:complete
MSDKNTAKIDGIDVEIKDNRTILDHAKSLGKDIPTLCHDDRLDPNGCCRMCLVEVDGWPRMAPSCATKITPGMNITTENERIDRHRKTLISLYLSDHPENPREKETGAPNQLLDFADKYNVSNGWPHLENKRFERSDDPNPFIHFHADKCISCARCVRYCDEVEAVSAITLAGRGSSTTIATADNVSLLESTCELCGGCIDVCPTGAMDEKIPLLAKAPPERELEKVRTTCNYCGVGCQMDLNVDPNANNGKGKVVKITSPDPGTTTNDGNLCVKGRFAYDFIDHKDRITSPLIRDKNGILQETSWEVAIEYAAQGLKKVREKYGNDGLGFISSSRCTGEENYLMQKMSRTVFQTNNIHQCAAT